MSWQDDPEIQQQMRLRSVRGRLLRSTIIWGPLFLATLAGTLFYAADILFLDRENGGTWVLVTILGILAVLFGFQAIQSLLDFFDKPRVESGYVTRSPLPSDRRVQIIALTDFGRKAFRTMAERHGDWIGELFEHLSARERDELMVALGKLKQSVRKTLAKG